MNLFYKHIYPDINDFLLTVDFHHRDDLPTAHAAIRAHAGHLLAKFHQLGFGNILCRGGEADPKAGGRSTSKNAFVGADAICADTFTR